MQEDVRGNIVSIFETQRVECQNLGECRLHVCRGAGMAGITAAVSFIIRYYFL